MELVIGRRNERTTIQVWIVGVGGQPSNSNVLPSSRNVLPNFRTVLPISGNVLPSCETTCCRQKAVHVTSTCIHVPR
ncbi:unnamed protein product [Heligmosomoides polygyrus]|uniref:Uncharacterized protein n=1 Tax=Heligmosomoides polygyrus TaxID=6339 RepID=A0A3P8E2W6_HELPZ|nr:unnamed protein product [Heligmosomoides polygyrus]